MDKPMAIFFAIYLAFAFVGGFWDGKILATTDETAMEGVSQLNILTNPFDAVSGNPVAALGASINYLKQWGNILILNFSFLQGNGQIIRWGMMALIAIPTIYRIMTYVLARGR